MSVQTKRRDSGDVFYREDLSRDYTTETVEVDNSNGDAVIVLPAGYPMIAGVPAVLADIGGGSVDGFVVEYQYIDIGDVAKVPVFARGTGVTVIKDKLPAEDVDGDDFDADDLATDMAGLDFIVRSEADYEEQTE